MRKTGVNKFNGSTLPCSQFVFLFLLWVCLSKSFFEKKKAERGE